MDKSVFGCDEARFSKVSMSMLSPTVSSFYSANEQILAMNNKFRDSSTRTKSHMAAAIVCLLLPIERTEFAELKELADISLVQLDDVLEQVCPAQISKQPPRDTAARLKFPIV